MVLIGPEWNGRGGSGGCRPVLERRDDLLVEAGIPSLVASARLGTRSAATPSERSFFTGQQTLTSLTEEVTLWAPADAAGSRVAARPRPDIVWGSMESRCPAPSELPAHPDQPVHSQPLFR
jgi:hypothetical protein